MNFNSEKSLVAYFKDNILDSFKFANNVKLLEEVGVGFGIADIVLSELNSPYNILSDDKLNHLDINVYRIIERDKVVSLNHLSDLTQSNKKQINLSLEKLMRRNYVQRDDCLFSFVSRYEISFKKSIAFEMKLKNWKRALMQAYRYKWFADYAFVVLDDFYVTPALKNINLFKLYNVGLVSINKTEVYRHYNPPKAKPIDQNMRILLSETVLFS